MVRGGRSEEGSGWGTRVYLWWIHVDIWQNQYNIVKLKKKKTEKKRMRKIKKNTKKIKPLDRCKTLASHLIRSDHIRSVTLSCLTLCDPMNHSTPGLPVHHQLPEFTETHVHWVSDAIQPSHPLSPLSTLALKLSQLPASRSFPMSWLVTSGEYWSFSFSISPSNEHSGLISFRTDWFDLLAV